MRCELTAGKHVVFNKRYLTVDEQGMDTYTYQVWLSEEPSNTVIVTISGSDGTAVSVPASLTFTTENWSNRQTVTVTAGSRRGQRRRNGHPHPRP